MRQSNVIFTYKNQITYPPFPSSVPWLPRLSLVYLPGQYLFPPTYKTSAHPTKRLFPAPKLILPHKTPRKQLSFLHISRPLTPGGSSLSSLATHFTPTRVQLNEPDPDTTRNITINPQPFRKNNHTHSLETSIAAQGV